MSAIIASISAFPHSTIMVPIMFALCWGAAMVWPQYNTRFVYCLGQIVPGWFSFGVPIAAFFWWAALVAFFG